MNPQPAWLKFDANLKYDNVSPISILSQITGCSHTITIPDDNCEAIKAATSFTLTFKVKDDKNGTAELPIVFDPKDFVGITCPPTCVSGNDVCDPYSCSYDPGDC